MIIITESFNTKTICNGVVPLLLSPEKFACRDITYFGDTTPLCIPYDPVSLCWSRHLHTAGPSALKALMAMQRICNPQNLVRFRVRAPTNRKRVCSSGNNPETLSETLIEQYPLRSSVRLPINYRSSHGTYE